MPPFRLPWRYDHRSESKRSRIIVPELLIYYSGGHRIGDKGAEKILWNLRDLKMLNVSDNRLSPGLR